MSSTSICRDICVLYKFPYCMSTEIETNPRTRRLARIFFQLHNSKISWVSPCMYDATSYPRSKWRYRFQFYSTKTTKTVRKTKTDRVPSRRAIVCLQLCQYSIIHDSGRLFFARSGKKFRQGIGTSFYRLQYTQNHYIMLHLYAYFVPGDLVVANI